MKTKLDVNRNSAHIFAQIKASKERMDIDGWVVSTSVESFNNAPLKCTDVN